MRLLERGDSVVCLDNFATSSPANLDRFREKARFEFINADVTSHPQISGEFDGIFHLACPASPDEYMRLSMETLAIGSHGSEFVLQLAARSDCRVLLASTSEVYGDPLVHPQDESYWGNVNPIGPRSVYDESKRFAESLFSAHHRTLGTNIAIVRIFNTYGPGLRPNDGRVVSNFIAQAIANEDLTIYGDGTQTRSFCYVTDLVSGLIKMMSTNHPGPINLGNPNEISVSTLAEIVVNLTGSTSKLVYRPKPIDDPSVRKPNIQLAKEVLGWSPEIPLEIGLIETIQWQRSLQPLPL
jgi:dTDP-glucose 4,6-dehydratase